MGSYTPSYPTRSEVEAPQELSNDVIQDIPAASVALQLSTIRRMSSRTFRQPVLDSLPDAYWLGSTTDTEYKQVTSMDWSHYTMEVAELAVIVPMPDSLVDDENIPLWAEIRPRLASAFAKKIDAACLYGTSRPSVWTTDAIVPGAVAAGNTVTAHDPSGDGDTAQDLAQLGQLLAAQGHDLGAFVTGPGYQYKLYGERDANGNGIYGPPQGTTPQTIFGQPFLQVKSGVWDSAQADVVTGDFSRSIIGLRQDITFTMHTDGVITDPDNSNAVVLNLMQQDAKALRAVMRLAHVVVDQEVTQIAGHSHYPFGILAPFVPST